MKFSHWLFPYIPKWLSFLWHLNDKLKLLEVCIHNCCHTRCWNKSQFDFSPISSLTTNLQDICA